MSDSSGSGSKRGFLYSRLDELFGFENENLLMILEDGVGIILVIKVDNQNYGIVSDLYDEFNGEVVKQFNGAICLSRGISYCAVQEILDLIEIKYFHIEPLGEVDPSQRESFKHFFPYLLGC